MKKMMIAAAAAALTLSMMSTVYADDVVVRTSIGAGEVIYTETSEAADKSAEEVTALVRSYLKDTEEKENLGVFVDANADVSLDIGDGNAMNIKGMTIGNLHKSGESLEGQLVYSYDGVLGMSGNGNYKAYCWEKDGRDFSAVSQDDGEWTVTETDSLSDVFEELTDALDSEKASNFTLEGMLPNLYQSDNGEKFYVFVYNMDTILNTASKVDAAKEYTAIADMILGESDMKLITVISAETGMPRAISFNAAGTAGSVPGFLFGSDSDVTYSCNDLYATILLDEEPQSVEIPEEVLNAPVQEGSEAAMLEGFEERFDEMEDDLDDNV